MVVVIVFVELRVDVEVEVEGIAIVDFDESRNNAISEIFRQGYETTRKGDYLYLYGDLHTPD
jgi:hypothetical protein